MAANVIKQKLIRVLHTGKSALNWDDETYRAVLARFTGKTSSTKCTVAELESVLEHMHQSGFPRCNPRRGRRPHVARSREDVLAKIEALLTVSARPWQYAEAMARHMFEGRQAVEWLTDEELFKLMQELIADQKRRQKREAADNDPEQKF
ncbi:regulatory protein GemA [Erwinia tracheiphila]|uniref:Regulatory protein GemA n=1 Tax=Erwinia tracheiphila TaxID=65700 RepID=A0A0M2KLE3_9GAMM|nr:regulatory protein GemA [Erwinia tracheiphila]AXF75189.1 regulatory protein GemA [Erwinia tracheiphila]EOS94050.1 hypothetical protein ETR_15811 [Erwinia tracheiphila PSU-1]KKF38063.1 hypothetical protein SY86_00580 [Erwinia tracheiphila]UIA89455.1 regulatory protein GemA [Erwinia tracheiphila]UIA97837.1 regulatory protein GemA [Erwinia tracheiphila]